MADHATHSDPVAESTTPISSEQHDAEKPNHQPQSNKNHNPPAGDFPDGGTAAWLVVAGAWCAAFCSFGWINSEFEFRKMT